MAFVRVNGVVLHYSDTGTDKGPVIVFANSLGSDFRIWDAVAGGLTRPCRIIRYDKRGHGLSEATPAPYSMTDHVEDLAALLDHLKIRKAVIAGVSVGGMIAQGLAVLRPDLVSALVLMDTAHKIGDEDYWNTRIGLIERDGIASIADAILERWFTAAYRSPENADFAGYSAMLTRTPVSGYTGTCAAIRDADLTESARALDVPVLCMVGDGDGATPPDLVRSLAELIGGAQFEIIRDAGHLPGIEKPEKTTALINAFLATAGAQSNQSNT